MTPAEIETIFRDESGRALATLIRLHYREADYDGSWWGIRHDSTGPYWDPREWELTPRIGADFVGCA